MTPDVLVDADIPESPVAADGRRSVPKLIVISAPSGCGKTTIAREILNRHPEMAFSVSATTRPRRENEKEGVDYFFSTKEEFRKNIDKGALVEWEEIYGNFYVTLKREIDRALYSGRSMLFDVDVKGALSIKRRYPHETVLIFIEPPSMEILMERLRNRKTETEETIRSRLERVPMEMKQGELFDVSIVNDDLQEAIRCVDEVVRAKLTAPVGS